MFLGFVKDVVIELDRKQRAFVLANRCYGFFTICFSKSGFRDFRADMPPQFMQFKDNGARPMFNGASVFVDCDQREPFRIVER